MNKEKIYQKMNIGQTDIQKGEAQFHTLSPELRKLFLSDIHAEYQGDYFKSISFIYDEYPAFRKVILIQFAINGSPDEKLQLAKSLSNPYNHKDKIEDFFQLIYDWLQETSNPVIVESLSRGLLFYIDKIEVQNFLDKNFTTNVEFAKGVYSWLFVQPDWFREQHKQLEIDLWEQLQQSWPSILTNEFEIREINKSLDLNYDKNEIWFHEIENPWNYTDQEIKRLNSLGINIEIDGYIMEFSMGSPLITKLILNNKKIETFIGGPFVTDDNNSFLCCTTFTKKEGFHLVVINLANNEITEIDTNKKYYTPYKFENDEFIVITATNKIDVKKNTLRFTLNDFGLTPTMH